jgi:hypothetical protein
MRDVTEHIDEYAIGKGRKSDIISRKSLEVGIIKDSLFKWRGFELDVDTALRPKLRTARGPSITRFHWSRVPLMRSARQASSILIWQEKPCKSDSDKVIASEQGRTRVLVL